MPEPLRGAGIRHVGLRVIVMAHEVRLTWLQRTVLVAVATHADAKTGRCWPSLATLAAGTDITERSASAAVKQLERLGVLTVTRRGWNLSNVYVIHAAAIAGLPRIGAKSARATQQRVEGERTPGPEADDRKGRRRTHPRTGSRAHPNGTGNGTRNGDPPTPQGGSARDQHSAVPVPDTTAAGNERGPAVRKKPRAGNGTGAAEDPLLWLDALNRATARDFDPTPEHLREIRHRIGEGKYTAADAERVASWVAETWPGMRRGDFIRPSTVFGPKFDGYVQTAKHRHEHDARDVNAAWRRTEPDA